MQLGWAGVPRSGSVQGLQELTVAPGKLHETSLMLASFIAAHSVIQQTHAYYVPNLVLLLDRLGT